jgi:hypothetical protein
MTSLTLTRNTPGTPPRSRKFKVFTRRNVDQITQLAAWRGCDIAAMKAVSAVLPFRVNN